MISFSAQLLRVYFNDKKDAPKVWSIDCGEGAPEILVAQLDISAPCRAVFDASKVPCGWLVFEEVNVEFCGLEARVRIQEQGVKQADASPS